VYPSLRTPALDDAPALPRRGWFRVGGNVFAIGMTSLLTDVSSEMVNAILPIYLVFQLNLTPLQFGIFNGIYTGIAGIARIWGGLISDRRHRYKEVAGAGYAASTFCKLGLVAAGNAAVPASGVLFLDRVGKGIRTAPRDALISLSVAKARLGEAFGVHRALDTTGALLGPIVAFWVLDAAPRAYDAVFVISFLFGVLGLGVLIFFVRNRTPATGPRYRPHVALRAAVGLLREPRVRAVMTAAVLLALFTMGDAFVYLTFQHTTDFTTKFFPLLYVGTALIYLLLAVPIGRLADRIGRGRVFLTGQVFLVGAYALLLLENPGPAALIAILALLGTYYAATDGVLMALASAILPEDLRTSGIALLTTGIALAQLVASIAFGAMWGWIGPQQAVLVFTIGLVVVTALSTVLLAANREIRA
jgi:MFS family permease